MEVTGNQNVNLNSQFGTIVATHLHLQLNHKLYVVTGARMHDVIIFSGADKWPETKNNKLH